MERQPNCFLTADVILLVGREVLLVRRKNEPFRGSWCFPGGFVDQGEKIIDGAAREMMEETGIRPLKLDLFGAYGDPGRDPRGRTVTFVYWSREQRKAEARAGDDAAECGWFSLDQLPPMAFDHGQIAQDVRQRLKAMPGH